MKRGRCEMGDEFPDNGAGEPIYQPCSDDARHVIVTGTGNDTRACRRHAEEVADLALEIRPPLRGPTKQAKPGRGRR